MWDWKGGKDDFHIECRECCFHWHWEEGNKMILCSSIFSSCRYSIFHVSLKNFSLCCSYHSITDSVSLWISSMAACLVLIPFIIFAVPLSLQGCCPWRRSCWIPVWLVLDLMQHTKVNELNDLTEDRMRSPASIEWLFLVGLSGTCPLIPCGRYWLQFCYDMSFPSFTRSVEGLTWISF